MPGCRMEPSGPLAGLISCLWYWEGAPGPHARERLLPNGEVALILNLREGPIVIHEDASGTRHLGAAAVSGARSNCFTIDCNQQERVLGVQFHPGGAFPFFAMPIAELENGSHALADLWGAEAEWMRDRVLSESTPQRMLATMARCLMERMRCGGEVYPAVRCAALALSRSERPAHVSTLSSRIGISERRLRQLFHQQVGLAPKTFQRVCRLQHSLRYLRGRTAADWAETALACGYYDQPHMAHDFSALIGMTPSAYLAAATEHLNHVPLKV